MASKMKIEITGIDQSQSAGCIAEALDAALTLALSDLGSSDYREVMDDLAYRCETASAASAEDDGDVLDG